VIYAGQGTLAKSIFRVSTMGAISRQEVERLIAVVNKIMVK
jgi:2-aminoethylphosphonate-pyruvate transaminase